MLFKKKICSYIATSRFPILMTTTGDYLFIAAQSQNHFHKMPTPELGRVNFQRDYEKALQLSKEEGKPIFLLFQEIPGCSTCTNFGKNVLSPPLIVEAIETLFIPLVIHNNEDGKDKEILNKYNEPAWNNPVVRFINSDGQDIIKRADGLYQSLPILLRMKEALKALDRPIPTYMENLITELNNSDYQSATFTMACYWEGEKQLGKINGVTKTTPGWSGSKEVVQVIYNPSEVSEKDLSSISGFDRVNKESGLREVSSSERKYYLKHHSVYKYVPLTLMQATKVNSAIARQKEEEITEWLSPRQQTLVFRIQKANHKNFEKLKECDHEMGKLAEYEDNLVKFL